MNDALKHLQDRKNFFEEQIDSYHNYVDAAMATMQRGKGYDILLFYILRPLMSQQEKSTYTSFHQEIFTPSRLAKIRQKSEVWFVQVQCQGVIRERHTVVH